jgi:phosphoribosylformylglycinamidine synthase
MIGLVEDIDHITTMWFKDDGDEVYLLGTNKEELGASEYLSIIHGAKRGEVPEIDLEFERSLHDAILEMIKAGVVKSAHDCSEGGLGVALAESAIGNREHMMGAAITLSDNSLRPDALLFGETASRIIISTDPNAQDTITEIVTKYNIPVERIGRVGGDRLVIDGFIDIPLSDMEKAYYDALKTMMERR